MIILQNKKVIDMDRRQQPMLESARKMFERNRSLADTCRNLEDSLAFVRDEKLTLVSRRVGTPISCYKSGLVERPTRSSVEGKRGAARATRVS